HRIEDRDLHDRHEPMARSAATPRAGDRAGDFVPVGDDVGLGGYGRERQGSGEGNGCMAERCHGSLGGEGGRRLLPFRAVSASRGWGYSRVMVRTPLTLVLLAAALL